jgi:flagellar hook protein FlgE
MLRSMYSGVSGMRGFQTKLDVISNNIANVNTVGYKKSTVTFQDVLSQNISGATKPNPNVQGGINPQQVGLGVSIASIDVVHTPGSPMTTGVMSDLLIDGDGFFVVEHPGEDGGEQYLTRAGKFKMDAEGQLVTPQGYLVLDSEGESILIDPEEYQAFQIDRNGQVVGIREDQTEETIAVIGLTYPTNPEGLLKAGGSLYKMTTSAVAGEEGEITFSSAAEGGSKIITGQLEMSNVDLTEEFTEMIVAQRGFQSNSRVITTSDEILQEIVNLKR